MPPVKILSFLFVYGVAEGHGGLLAPLQPGVGEVAAEGVHGDVEVGITVGGPAQDGRAGQEVLYGERGTPIMPKET